MFGTIFVKSSRQHRRCWRRRSSKILVPKILVPNRKKGSSGKHLLSFGASQDVSPGYSKSNQKLSFFARQKLYHFPESNNGPVAVYRHHKLPKPHLLLLPCTAAELFLAIVVSPWRAPTIRGWGICNFRFRTSAGYIPHGGQ